MQSHSVVKWPQDKRVLRPSPPGEWWLDSKDIIVHDQLEKELASTLLVLHGMCTGYVSLCVKPPLVMTARMQSLLNKFRVCALGSGWYWKYNNLSFQNLSFHPLKTIARHLDQQQFTRCFTRMRLINIILIAKAMHPPYVRKPVSLCIILNYSISDLSLEDCLLSWMPSWLICLHKLVPRRC